MNMFQDNSHNDTFYFSSNTILDLRSNNSEPTVDTRFVNQYMVSSPLPLTPNYFDIPESSTCSTFDDNAFVYCPVPTSPGSTSVESLLSFSLDTPSPCSSGVSQPVFFPPSPETGMSFPSKSDDFGTFLGHYFYPQQESTYQQDIRLFSLSVECDSSACTPDSIKPNDHTRQEKVFVKEIDVSFITPFEENHLQPIKISMKSSKKKPIYGKNNNKPFVCTTCSRPFARKHDLQRHIRVHTGVKPYSCLNCKKAFIRTDALKHHLRVVDTCRLSPIIQAMKNSGDRRYRNL